jgi:hypothetical protein
MYGLGFAPLGAPMTEQLMEQVEAKRDRAVEAGDPHLRSSRAVTGYHIEARDGEVGHVEDFLVDDETWAIRYIMIDTRDWLPGKHVLLGPELGSDDRLGIVEGARRRAPRTDQERAKIRRLSTCRP